MFELPPRYTWRVGDRCTLYGVCGEFVVESVSMGYATLGGVRISQRYLQRRRVVPHTYARPVKSHSVYLRLSGLECRAPTPWRVLELEPALHRAKWLKYKKTMSRYDFLVFIRAVCPRVHVDDRMCIFFKDQPRRRLDDVVYVHGVSALRGKVIGIGHRAWYVVSCALGVFKCHRSTLWCKGY